MNKNILWLCGGVGVGVLSGLALYFSRKQETVYLEKDLLKKALADFKDQTFSLFITTAGVVNKIMKECGNKYELDNGKNVGDLIRDEVNVQFEQKKILILNKYGIEENDFITSIQEKYGKDEEIQNLVDAIFDGLEEALKGNGPSLKVRPEVYKILTKEKSLDIVEKIFIQSSKTYLNVIQALIKEGASDITIEHPKVAKRIGELNMKLKKRKLIESEGIHLEPDSPTDVLGKVTQEYKDTDQGFSSKLREMQNRYISIQDRINKDITTEEQIDEEFKK